MTSLTVWRATSIKVKSSFYGKPDEGKPFWVNTITIDTEDGKTEIMVYSKGEVRVEECR